jgi:uncharacterized membrane protein
MVGVVAVFFLIGFITSSITDALRTNGSFFVLALVYLISFAINAFITLGLVAISLKIIRKQETGWKELIDHKDSLIAYMVAAILFGVGTFIGTLLVIIPGCMFLSAYYFYTYGILDKKLSIIESFKHSARLTKGIRMKIFGILVLVGVFNLIGFFAFFVGLLFTYPITLLFIAHVYEKLSLGAHQEAEVVVQPKELEA